VDAAMQDATQPGKTLGDVLTAARKAYVDYGFSADEWEHHHQGGATGYAGRTAKAVPGSRVQVLDTTWAQRLSERLEVEIPLGAAFAWNPSAPGVKSEDTFLLSPDGTREIITGTPAIPDVDSAITPGWAGSVRKSGILMRHGPARIPR
jgi:hypothetical protein